MTKSLVRLKNYSAINIRDCQWKYNKIHSRVVKCGLGYSLREKSLMLRCLLFGSPFMHSSGSGNFYEKLYCLLLSSSCFSTPLKQRLETKGGKSSTEGEMRIKNDDVKGAFVIYFILARKSYSVEVKKVFSAFAQWEIRYGKRICINASRVSL